MALTDNVFFNTRERALSSDVNDLESLEGRNLMESLRWVFATQVDSGAGMASSTPRSVVGGGLQVSPAGSDVGVSPGVIFQQSATLSPLPGALDSSYRFGRLGSSVVVPMPSPGSNTYYLLEAQIVQVLTSSQSRDIFNPITQTFVPTVVPKQYEFQVQFQLVTGGSSYPAATGGDWVVLAGIFRPAGGGPVSTSDIVDLSPRWSDALAAQQKIPGPFSYNTPTFLAPPNLRTVFVPGAAASNNVILAADVQHRGKQYTIRTQTGGIDPTVASILEPGVVLAADTWYYLYLYSFRNQLPRGAYAGASCNGVLVLRSTPPIEGGAANSSLPSALPAPFNADTGLEGVCIGAVLRNGANTGWAWQETMGDEQRVAQYSVYAATPGIAFVPLDLDAGLIPVPVCRSKIFDVETSPQTPPAGATITAYSRTTNNADTFRTAPTISGAQYGADVLEVPSTFGNLIGVRTISSSTSTVAVIMRGFKWWGSR